MTLFLAKLKSIVKHAVRGCGYLPLCGDHPGTLPLIIFILLGGVAGSKGGINGFLGGTGLMSVFMVPLYLIGSYERSTLDPPDSPK